MAFLGLFRRKPFERVGFELYGAAVVAARDPTLFEACGVPDTLDGRFDLIGLHAALLIRRLRADPDPRGAPLAQAVFDAMFADMDVTLREMGVGDLSVGKRVKSMWEAFHGRARAYEAAVDAGDRPALAMAIERNVFRRDGPPGSGAEQLAEHALRLAPALAEQPIAELAVGAVRFPALMPTDA